MKKISQLFLITFIVSFVLPSVALASWWNPFSWKIFNRSAEKIELTQDSSIVEIEVQASTTTSSPTNQTDEIQKLKDEIEELKIQKTNTSITVQQPVYIPPIQPIIVTDACPNIIGIQPNIPDGMFLYGVKKECLTQNEISYIADKIAEEKNNEAEDQRESASNYAIDSEECEDARDNYDSLYKKMNKIEDLSERADFAVNKVNPAGREVDTACDLDMSRPTLEPMKSTRCYVNYYGSTASVNCYTQ
jgi:TolA-binding protein